MNLDYYYNHLPQILPIKKEERWNRGIVLQVTIRYLALPYVAFLFVFLIFFKYSFVFFFLFTSFIFHGNCQQKI